MLFSFTIKGNTLEHKKHEDRLNLSGIKIFPHIGVTAEERAIPQECQADLAIWGDFRNAAETDSLDQSIDYCRILDSVQDIAGAREYLLLETLAYAIIQEVLKKFAVQRTRVKVRKRPAILLDTLNYVEVEIEGVQPGD
jgi:7,8-dihydroneopterin aldolase/epimerase/oxygenase